MEAHIHTSANDQQVSNMAAHSPDQISFSMDNILSTPGSAGVYQCSPQGFQPVEPQRNLLHKLQHPGIYNSKLFNFGLTQSPGLVAMNPYSLLHQAQLLTPGSLAAPPHCWNAGDMEALGTGTYLDALIQGKRQLGRFFSQLYSWKNISPVALLSTE